MEKLLNITINELIDMNVANNPDTIAVKYTDRDYCRTYKEFSEECDKIAKGFIELGLEKGDHVAIWATNYPEWILTLFAAAKIGVILVTVNTSYKIFELEYILKQSDAKMLIMIDGYRDINYISIVNELLPELKNSEIGKFKNKNFPYLETVISIENKYDGMVQWQDIIKLGENITDKELRKAKADTDPDDVINMQYTSGTTGFPKGVMLTHNNIINNGKGIGDCMKLTVNDRLCIPVPFFHCFGLVLAIMASVTHGTSMVPVDSFSALKVMQAIQNEKCTAVHGVPTMFIAMLEHPQFNEFNFSSLRTGIMAGSPCPIKVMQEVIDKMNMKEITITYGQTEASPACTMTNTDDSIELRVATVGRIMPHTEAKITDPETGIELPVGTPGEFCSRGYHIMKGYYKMPEATQAAIDDDGWLHTGDIAVVDENGYYKITGRIKDMIIRGGENIYPKEIEEFIYTHPSVKDVQVIGVPSKQYGEEVMAYIILKQNQTITDEEIKDYVRSHMARHKTPKFVAFIEEFPMTASGKIQKYKLREMAIELLSLQKDAAIETA